MKKKLGLIAILAVTLVLVFGLSSGAWFSDAVSSTGNSLTAATLYLDVNGARSSSQTYVLNNMKPGDWALAGQAILKNTGSIPGHLWYEIVNVSPSAGPLGALVYPQFQMNVAPWTRFDGANVINNSVGMHVDVMDLAPGASLPIVAYFNWPPTAGDNAAQGAALTFDVVWHLDQIH